jgi:hypothetical protein
LHGPAIVGSDGHRPSHGGLFPLLEAGSFVVPAPQPLRLVASLWAAAWGVKLALGRHNPILVGAAVLGPYGVLYFSITHLLRVEECARALARFTRFRR